MTPGSKRTGLSLTAAALLAAALLAGCGKPTVDGICSELKDRKCSGWTGVDECKEAGHGLHSRAENAGCDAQFQDYLQCLDDDGGCSWESTCAGERQVVESCLGGPF